MGEEREQNEEVKEEGQGADRWGERLPRKLGTWSAVAVLVGSTIGSGIFRSPAEVAESIHQTPIFVAAWVLGGLVALAGALTFAELAAMYPRTGGIYVYLREAFGPLPAFLFGWSELLVLRPAAYGAIAVISAEYMWRLFGIDGGRPLAGLPISWAQGAAAVFIVIVGIVNYRGIKLGAIIQNVSTVLKIGALLLLVLLGFLLTPDAIPAAPPADVAAPVGEAIHPLSAFGLAMVAVLWAYDGWSDVGFVGGEVKDPGKGLPKAFILGTGIVVALYLLINAVYLEVVPIAQMPGRPLIAADVAQALMGPAGAAFISAAVMVSTFGTLNGSMMTGPRVFFAMAEDKLFFERLARVHPVHGTPAGSIALSIVLGVGFVSVRSFGELADQFVLGIWPFYALAVAAVIVLRIRKPNVERPYRAWGYPVVPIAFLLAAIFILGNALISEPLDTLLSVGVVLTGIPVYYLWSARRDRA
jgi:amino acid transporter